MILGQDEFWAVLVSTALYRNAAFEPLRSWPGPGAEQASPCYKGHNKKNRARRKQESKELSGIILAIIQTPILSDATASEVDCTLVLRTRSMFQACQSVMLKVAVAEAQQQEREWQLGVSAAGGHASTFIQTRTSVQADYEATASASTARKATLCDPEV